MHGLVFSIRTILALIIGLMGALAMLQALVSGEIHRSHAYDNQRLSLQKLIRLKTEDLLEELTRNSSDLGSSLQMGRGFQQAFDQRGAQALEGLMDNQFHDYFVTTELIKLEELAVFDGDFTLVTQVREQGSQFSSSLEACAPLIQQARTRSGPERMKIFSGLCVQHNKPYHAVILPIGGLRLKGYLIVVTDPSHNLARMESALGMPLSILLPDRQVIHRSEAWPTEEEMAGTIQAEYQLLSKNDQPVLILSVADDIRPLMGYVPQTRLMVMTVVILVTFMAIALAAWVLRRTTVNPLKTLTDHLHRLREDRKLLGQTITVGGTQEIRELARSFNDMSGELGNLYRSLETMAFTDQLTGLPNRNRLQEQLQLRIREDAHGQATLALLLMDLDRFKVINETLGHQVGDLLLTQVGARLQQTLRGSDPGGGSGRERDLIVRLGGDEFCALLFDVSEIGHANAVCHRIMAAMEEPFEINEYKLIVKASIGIAIHPLHGKHQDDLLRCADIAMYQAKMTRQGYLAYDTSFDNNSLRHLALERDLHNVISHEQLVLYYQPKIDLQTGEICGAEALVRWQHPELGMVPPDEFIPLAEQTGLIGALSIWVLHRALRDCSEWRGRGFNLGVSINLSAINLHDRSLLDEISNALAQWGFNPNDLVLEITESAVMSDPDHALQVLEKLRELGIKLSIDDFGTGHSSLAYLKKLPVTEIKVDRSFVRELVRDAGDESIIRAVVALARHRRLSVVAEGVEDWETYLLLRDLGCEMAQGYYIARPMPFEEYLAWIGNSGWRPQKSRGTTIARGGR